MSLWRAGAGLDIILRDEWRLNQRSLPPLPPYPFISLASPPRAYTYIMRKAPAPASPPRWGRMPGLSHAIAAPEAAVMPWALLWRGNTGAGAGSSVPGTSAVPRAANWRASPSVRRAGSKQSAVASGMTGCSRGHLAYDLEGYVQHGVHAVEFAVLWQGPGFLFCEVGVGVCEDGPDAFQSAVECLLVEVCTDGLVEGCRLVEDLAVSFGEFAVVGDGTAAVLGDHGQGTLGRVAEVVCQVGVDAVDDGLFE